MIRRGFVEAAEGQIHYRAGGVHRPASLPLYAAHAAPGSSRGLVPLLEALQATRFVVAPDMLGCGDSAAPLEPPEIADYADCVIRVLDALGLDRIDFYGSHTGAQVGCELALRHPWRVRRLVLDGLAIFPEPLRQELLVRYAPPRSAQADGQHLVWAWNFVRDLRRYFPYYDQRPETALHNPEPAAAQLQLAVTDVLKTLDTYHLAYRAAFSHHVAERLPLVKAPVLLMAAASDPLSVFLESTAAVLPTAARLLLPTSAGVCARAAAIDEFLG